MTTTLWCRPQCVDVVCQDDMRRGCPKITVWVAGKFELISLVIVSLLNKTEKAAVGQVGEYVHLKFWSIGSRGVQVDDRTVWR